MPAAKHDRNHLLIGTVLVISFFVLDAVVDSFIFGEGSFTGSLFAPRAVDLAHRLMVLLIVCCFVHYSIRSSRARAALEQAVKDALAKAENERGKLVAVVEAMGDGISIQDRELTVLYQNRAHQEMMGSHVGESCHLAYRQQDKPCDGCHLPDAFRAGEKHRAEIRVQKEQEIRFFEIVASAVKDPVGTNTAGIEVVRDVTERKHAEQTARNQAALLQHLIDTIPNPIYYQDPSGRFIWCNSAFAAWFGKAREHFIARTITEVAPPEVSRVFLQKEPAPQQGTVHEASLLCGSEMREVIIYRSMFSDRADERGGVVGVIIDITERKGAEEEIRALNTALTQQAIELQQVNRELEAFSHAISHDLRTPLTRIYSYAQLLHGYSEVLDADGLFYIKSVNEGCLQVEALLNALLDLSRVTEVQVTMTQVDLSHLATEKARELQLSDPGRRVDFRIAPDLSVKGDRQLLHIALENLIANAWKYTCKADAPLIEMGSFLSNDGETVFFIRDNGAGFDTTRSHDLFKPFRRLHSSQEFPGTGLGLATVRRIIKRHNGRVWGESKPGMGATFYFTING